MNVKLTNEQINNKSQKQQMNMNQRLNDGFSLIWLYWYKKYIFPFKTSTLPDESEQTTLQNLKKIFVLQAVEGSPLQQKIHSIKERLNLPNNRSIYVIDPEQEIKAIEQTIIRQCSSAEGSNHNQMLILKKQQMMNELYSYYLNSKNLFIIYRKETGSQGSLSVNPNTYHSFSSSNQPIDNISDYKQRHLSKNSLIVSKNSLLINSAIIRDNNSAGLLRDNRTYTNSKDQIADLNISELGHKYFPGQQDDSIQGRGESVSENFDRIEHKIEELQILDRLAEFDGIQIWNCKYKHMPHSLVKVKKASWAKCLTLPLIHPSQPKPIDNLPIFPRLTRLRPSTDKLLPFLSYLRLLEQYFPSLAPNLDSIFQYNSLPVVFSMEDASNGGWRQQATFGMLCYSVVFGDEEGPITSRSVERYAEENPHTLLAKSIKQMNKKGKERIRTKQDMHSKSLIFYQDDLQTDQIW